ncbi:hypothetical protein [Cytophaga aurantiaca]|uniref:hypothetical protein n=1 Tax=Cytophaga aurantiaca TaxID=29530 RepID=UPI0003689925|nr:hypothetical protein [Cytophaga aurantiaca]
MIPVNLYIEKPILFKSALDQIENIYKENFNFHQDRLNENLFIGKIDPEKINTFYELGRQYSYKLFLETNKIKLTGQKRKIEKVFFESNQQDAFLKSSKEIELINGKKINFHLALIGLSDSSQFDRVFAVMNNEDKLQIENFVGIKEYHYKTSFVHPDYNISYRIIDGNLIFFKTFNQKRKIVLDSIIEVKWEKK